MLDPGPAAAAQRPPTASITPPGSASATVTRKKRNPAANAGSASTPTLPRKLTKNASRTANPLSVNGTSRTRKKQRAHHVVDPRRELDPDRLRGRPDREHAHRLDREVKANSPQQARVTAEVLDAVVERAQRALEPDARAAARRREQRPRASARRTGREHERAEDERALEPEVGADVVAADREQEADGAEQHRRRAAERALEQDDRGIAPTRPGWRREVSRIRTASPPIEVGRTWPAVYETKYARVSQATARGSPAPRAATASAGHRHDGEVMIATASRNHRESRRARTSHGLADVDLPDEVARSREPVNDKRRRRRGGPRFMRREPAWIAPEASIASRMSSSECAGDRGSDRTSSPARSATGSDGWSGIALAVPGQPVHGQEVDARRDPLLAEGALVVVAGRAGAARRRSRTM